MTQTAAAKKEKPKPAKPKPIMQTAMPKGASGKFDVLYRSSLFLQADKKPEDKTPKKTTMTQSMAKCAAAYTCKASTMPLSKRHQCIICAFCLHPECGYEVNETPTYKTPSTTVNLICHACAIGGDLKKFVNNNEISLGLYKLNRFIRPAYPKIILVPSTGDESEEEEAPEGTKKSSFDDSNDDSSKKYATKDDNGVKPMECDDEEGDKGKKTDERENKKKIDNDDQSASTVTNKNGGQDNTQELDNNPDQTNVQMEDNLLYMDLHLNIPATTDKSSPIAPIATLSTRLEGWLKGMQEMDDTFKLHTVDPNHKSQKVMHHQKDFPTNKLAELKEFFKGARPIPDGGKVFLKIKASFKQSPKELIGNAQWSHSEKKELFRSSSIQACHVDIVGWLLYSTRSMDKETLQATLSQKVGTPLSLRWMRINDGSPWQKGRNTSDDPRALHIECASSHSHYVETKIRQIYGSKKKKFPLHIRLRFIPSITKLLDMNSVAKFRVLMNRQDGWAKQHLARSREDIVEIDMTCNGSDQTLRDLIMEIKGKDSDVPLFASIDRKWNGQGFNFSFHPDKLIEASMTIRGLFPRLAHEHGEEAIHKCFTPRAVVEGRRMTYDPKLGTVTTEADESIAELDDLDLDMVVKATETKETFGERQVFVKERGDEDSVSTFQSKRAPPAEIATTTNKKAKTSEESTKSSKSSTSSTSSLSVTTKTSVNNKLHAFDQEMKAFQSEVNSKVDLIIQSLNIQTQGQVVTPTKHNVSTPVKNNTTPNNQSEGDKNNTPKLAQVSEDQNGSSKTS